MCRDLLIWLCLLLAPLSAATARAEEPGVKGTTVKEPAAGKQTARKTKTKKPVKKEPAAPEPADKEKELSGMSIVGNDEAPKSLTIVPWKSSEIGGETSLNMMLNEQDAPVDREVFMRQLDFYEISTRK